MPVCRLKPARVIPLRNPYLTKRRLTKQCQRYWGTLGFLNRRDLMEFWPFKGRLGALPTPGSPDATQRAVPSLLNRRDLTDIWPFKETYGALPTPVPPTPPHQNALGILKRRDIREISAFKQMYGWGRG